MAACGNGQGDAAVTAALETSSACEAALSPETAVEGYVGSQFIGGVVVDMVVPAFVVPFDFNDVYLPVVAR